MDWKKKMIINFRKLILCAVSKVSGNKCGLYKVSSIRIIYLILLKNKKYLFAKEFPTGKWYGCPLITVAHSVNYWIVAFIYVKEPENLVDSCANHIILYSLDGSSPLSADRRTWDQRTSHAAKDRNYPAQCFVFVKQVVAS